MQLQLQMIGTGSAFAKKYFNNNALITCNGYTFMIDCGITAPWSLHQMNVPLSSIQGVLITHLHADHIGGLEEYALRMKYVYQIRPTLYIEAGLIEPLWEHSLKAGLNNTVEGPCDLDNYFDIVLLKAGHRSEIQPGLTIELLRTHHYPNMESYSIIMNDHLFYSGDVTFDESMLLHIANNRNCAHILHDCQLEGSGIVHTTLSQLLTLPNEIQRRTWLMHYGDTMPTFIGKTGDMTFLEQHRIYTFSGSAT